MSQISFADMLAGRDIHIIGCGSLGSKYAAILGAKGAPRLHVWDYDTVEERNLYNQRFLARHISMQKTDAVVDYCRSLRAQCLTEFFLHREKFKEGAPVSGIVLAGVDSMAARGEIWQSVRNNPSVSFFADGRVGMEAGKVFGLDPNNPEHAYRYEHEPHWHTDPEHMMTGACKTEFPRPEISDIVAAHVLVRLDEWLQLEQGRTDAYMNFYGFCFVPTFTEVTEYWDDDEGEDGEDE